MESIIKKTKDLQEEIKQATEKIGLSALIVEHQELQKLTQDPAFWQDSQKAQEISQRKADLARRIEPWQKLQTEIADLIELAATGDSLMEKELEEQLSTLHSQLSALMRELRFNGPFDDHDVILSIYAGAGGTDAQDWAQMLLRMYTRWAEAHDLRSQILDLSQGEEAGIKSATIKISGHSTGSGQAADFLYGKLAGEHGVHRLVRLSPFNADNLRQTSFAKVEILPLIDKPSEAEIDEKDLKIDVFRAGGHGGQSVNTTDSAVRVTHLPTGISVAIQTERSQLQNKQTALNILRSKLVQLQLEQHAKTLTELKGPNEQAAWGNQIRSYVLHPYKQVKDNRTDYETTDPDKILNGALDPLIDAWLNNQ